MRRFFYLLPLLLIIISCGGNDNNKTKEVQWSLTQLGADFEIRAIACGDNETVITVGSDGRIARSENSGNSWTTAYRISDIGYALNGITYCSNMFMIAGDKHTILYSANEGKSWLIALPSFTEIDYKSVTCNGSVFLLAGETTLSIGNEKFDNRTALSVNSGASWESHKVSGVIPDNSAYIAVKLLMFGGGTYYLATDGGFAGYSSDGKVWNKLPTPVNADYNFTGMAQGTDNGTKLTLFCATTTGDNATGKVVAAYNDNITEWSNAMPHVTEPVRGVAFGKDAFMVLTDNSAYFSDNFTDGNITWTEGSRPQIINQKITTVNYCGNAFWVGTDRGQIWRAFYH